MSKWFKVVPCDEAGNRTGILASPFYTQPNGGVPTLQQDLIGNAHNYYPTRQRGYVPGRSLAINNTRADLWEGPTPTYVFPTVAQQMAIVSTSANDTSAGIGVRQVEVHYLDNLYVPHTELVTLNGVTPVNMVATNVLRINRFHAIQWGTVNGNAAGNISLTNLGGTITYAFMAAGNSTARQAIYTVPAGVTGYINHWQGSSGTPTGTHFTQIELRATADSLELYSNFLLVDNIGTLNNGLEINYPIPIPVPATADVKLSAISDAANANAICLGAIMGWFET